MAVDGENGSDSLLGFDLLAEADSELEDFDLPDLGNFVFDLDDGTNSVSSRSSKRPSDAHCSLMSECEGRASQKRIRGEIRKAVESGDSRIWFETKAPTKSFCGRQEQLSQLQASIQQNTSENAQVTVVCGPAGIGKTEFVKHCATNLFQMGFNVVWINAETKSGMKDSFTRLAKNELEISTMGYSGEEDICVIVNECYGFFRNTKSIFIFDNAESLRGEDGNGIETFLPFSGSIQPDWAKPNILVTSRKQNWPVEFQIYPLNALTIDEGLQFLNKSLGPPPSLDIYKQLLTELSCFPQALQQAVSYIRNIKQEFAIEGLTNCPISYFLDLYRQDRSAEKVLHYKFWEETNDNYGQTAWTVWQVNLAKMLKTKWGSIAKLIMSISSFLAADKIPNFLFLNWTEGNSKKEFAIKAIQMLATVSLLTYGDGFINLHRLTQKVIRVELGDHDVEILLVATKLLKNYLSNIEEHGDKKMFDRSKLCLPHGIQLCHHLADRQSYLDNPEFADFVLTVSSALNELGDTAQAITFGIKFSEETFNNLETKLAISDELGKAYQAKFEQTKARNLYARIVPLCEEELGPNHPLALSMANHQGNILMHAAKFQESLEKYTSNLEKCLKTDGYNGRLTLIALAGIANVNKCLGNYDLARQKYEDALQRARENVRFGENHRITIQIKYGLALVYIFLNRNQEAYQILLEYAQYNEERYGLEHVDTLRGYVKVVEVLIQLGHFVEADDLVKRIDELTEKELGEYSPEFFILGEHRVHIRREMGVSDLKEEEELHLKLRKIKIEKLSFSENGVGVIHHEKNLARISFEKGNFEDALAKAVKVQEKQKNRWTKEHPDVKISQELIDKCTMALSQMSLASPQDDDESEAEGDLEENEIGSDPKYSCHLCSKKYQYEKTLTRHISEAHLQTIKFKCELCGKIFPRKDKLTRHMMEKKKPCSLNPPIQQS